MNILVPDSWLRENLKTDATPKQLKDCLSLCGPSIERINTVGKETVYDIEITGNRPDAMSILGIAREASVILPKFDIDAKLLFDPYKKVTPTSPGTIRYPALRGKGELPLLIKTDENLNPRFTMVVFDHVSVKPSPEWMQKRLTQVGVRPLNNVIDITNYLMHLFGQPVHAFDYDSIKGHTMTLRASKKGEKLTTLDGKEHTLPGDDIVIQDGSGKLIDLCGIMGGNVSKISQNTKRVILFVQTYDPIHIRKTWLFPIGPKRQVFLKKE
jgi:phenylalanyl-tRNA synthetase beta chain